MSKVTKEELQIINRVLAFLVVVLALAFGYVYGQRSGWFATQRKGGVSIAEQRIYLGEAIELPRPLLRSTVSVEAAMQGRRSRRSYRDEPITLNQLSQVLWSLQGKTADWGGRTTPSAKGAYPLELTVVVKNVDEFEPGVYHYDSDTHSLTKTVESVPERFDEAAVQNAGQTGPVVIFISADYGRMTKAFDGVTHDNNVLLEVGHAGQNMYLQVESLGLGTVVMGGFNPTLMQEVLAIPGQEELIYQIPVGVPSED